MQDLDSIKESVSQILSRDLAGDMILECEILEGPVPNPGKSFLAASPRDKWDSARWESVYAEDVDTAYPG